MSDKKGTKNKTLAEQLKVLKLSVPDEKTKSPKASNASPAPIPPPPPEPAPEEHGPLSDEDLMAQAFDKVSRDRIYREKFGPGSPPSPTGSARAPKGEPLRAEQVEAEKIARERVAERREEAFFERMVGPVEKLEDKYYKPEPGSKVRERPYSSEPAQNLITPSLPRSGPGLNALPPLDGTQRAMLKRAEKLQIRNTIPELNLRGDGVDDALRQLELFMHQAWKERQPFVRIIHGRGLRSEDEPVLKPTVLTWLEGPGLRYIRGYVPELQGGSDYGSLIVELEEREDRTT